MPTEPLPGRLRDPGADHPVLMVHLDAVRSRALLAAAPIGRLAVVVRGRPEIFPIAHAYDEATDGVIFPTWPGTKLTAALEWPWVAFEVDGFSEEDGAGWSVAVVGRAEIVTDVAAIERARAGRHVPWRTGPGAQWVRIVPEVISGREVFTVRPRSAVP